MSESSKKESGKSQGLTYTVLLLTTLFVIVMDTLGVVTLFNKGSVFTAPAFIWILSAGIAAVGAVNHALPVMVHQPWYSRVLPIASSLLLTGIGFFGLINESKYMIESSNERDSKIMYDYAAAIKQYEESKSKFIAQYYNDKATKIAKLESDIQNLLNVKNEKGDTIGWVTVNCTNNYKRVIQCINISDIKKEINTIEQRELLEGDVVSTIGGEPVKPFMVKPETTWVEVYIYNDIRVIIALAISLSLFLIITLRGLRAAMYRYGNTVIISATPRVVRKLDYRELGAKLFPDIHTYNPAVRASIWAIIDGYTPDMDIVAVGQLITAGAKRLTPGVEPYADARTQAIALCTEVGLIRKTGVRNYRYTRALEANA